MSDLEIVHTAIGHFVYRGERLICSSSSIEDADRIVACLNACEGITTEELEAGKIAALQAENARLREQIE